MPSAHIAGMNHSDSPTPAPTDDPATYLRSIAAFELLSPEQEVDLAAAIEAGLYADHLLTAETTGVEAGSQDYQALLRGKIIATTVSAAVTGMFSIISSARSKARN